MREMDNLVKRYFPDDAVERRTVLDIGSYDVNGSLRSLFPEWNYIGIDRVAGPNVNILAEEGRPFPVGEGCADLVVSASCFQYVKNPFQMTEYIHTCTKPGGFVFICAARSEREGLLSLPKELCPNEDTGFDCWRFLRDGMRSLLTETGFTPLETYYVGSNCWGVGIK